MSDNHTPKRLLFGLFSQKRPAHGVKLHWWDKIKQDLKSFSIPETSWYVWAQERGVWRVFMSSGIIAVAGSKY